MKTMQRSLFYFTVSLMISLTGILPASAQLQMIHRQTKLTTDEIAKIPSAMLRNNYDGINTVAIVGNYARVIYLGQNIMFATLKYHNGNWKIIESTKQSYCNQVSCLIKKGVPANIATQLITAFKKIENRNYRELEKNLISFQKAWAKVNPNIAPFLGNWFGTYGNSNNLYFAILPSYNTNQVCIVGIKPNSQFVDIGKVANSILITPKGKLTTGKSNYDQGDILEATPRNSSNNYLEGASSLDDWYFHTETRKRLKDSGCTSTLPNSSASIQPPSKNISTMNKQSAQTNTWGDSISSLPVVAKTQSQNNINFKVCYESKTWIRPTPGEQKTHLTRFNGRYTPEEIAELGGDYWKYNIFAFTTFPGGSGNVDIGQRAGLWTPQDSNNTKKCNDYVTQLNSGKTGAVWILNYKIVSLKWLNNRYILQVKQTKQGWQQIQFPRRESLESLPLTVMNERGQNVPVLFYK